MLLGLAERLHPLLDEWRDLAEHRAVPAGGHERLEPPDQLIDGELSDPDAVEVVEPVLVPLTAGALDLLDLPDADQVVGREDLVLRPRRPTDEREVVEERLRQVALTLELGDRGRPVPLGQFLAVGAEHRRHVGHRRDGPAERPIDEEMFRHRGEPLLAAHDVADRHRVVVDDHREVVGREAVRLQEDLVFDRARLPLDAAVHEVVDRKRAFVRHLEAHDVGLGLRARGRLGRRDVAAMPVVPGELVPCFLLPPDLGEALLGAEAEVRGALGDELGRVLLVEGQALRLDVRRVRPAFARALVPGDAEPVQPVVDRVDRPGDKALLIGVLDPQDERAGALQGEKVVVKDRAHAADVELTGGGGREAQPNAHREVSLGRYSCSAWLFRRAATGARNRSNGRSNGSVRHRRAG